MKFRMGKVIRIEDIIGHKIDKTNKVNSLQIQREKTMQAIQEYREAVHDFRMGVNKKKDTE